MRIGRTVSALGHILGALEGGRTGGTVSVRFGGGLLDAIDGFVVGGQAQGLQMPIASEANGHGVHFVSADYGTLTGWLRDLPETTDTVGFWQHDGVWFFDSVRVFGDRDMALSAAKERGEIAIWDGVNSQEVLV